jgi:protein-tyrosine phosphatase
MTRPPTALDATFAPLVLDDDGEQPRRLCSTDDALSDDVNPCGLRELRCSSSAQFSAAGFRNLVQRLGRPGPEQLYVVDLRQESHGFVDGAAVSWYAQNNWGNVGLDCDETAVLESLRLKLLASSTVVWLGRADLAKAGLPQVLEPRRVRNVLSEQAVVALPPGHYMRLPVPDHGTPSDGVLQTFIGFIDELPRDSWLHVHCRGGKGRSAMFLAIYDVLRNAAALDLGAIVARIQRLTGYDLEKQPDPGSPKAPYIAERLPMLRALHAARRPAGAK